MKYPPNYIQCEQHSAQWYDLRLGKVTASRVADVMSFLKNGANKGKSSQAREEYKFELLQEALTGQTAEHYVSAAMQFGIENEILAKEAYSSATGNEIESIGLVLHPHIPRSAASPDGLIGDDGLVECKVPTTKTHLGYFLGEVVPEDYKPQMLWQMACTGRSWCDFVSYDPRLPSEFNFFSIRFERDEEAIAEMEKQVEQFIAELNTMAEVLQSHAKMRPQVENLPSVPKAELPPWREP